MPGSTPPTSQLDCFISMTAMIVLFWSSATRDLLKSFGWGIGPLHRLDAATKLPFPRGPPVASLGPSTKGGAFPTPPIRPDLAAASPFPASDRQGRSEPATSVGLQVDEVTPLGCVPQPASRVAS